jgi:hypothetical protein
MYVLYKNRVFHIGERYVRIRRSMKVKNALKERTIFQSGVSDHSKRGVMLLAVDA